MLQALSDVAPLIDIGFLLTESVSSSMYIFIFFRVGDAMVTIASCTSFPEPFITPPGQKRLAFGHKKFAGRRSSDHLAMLNAFYQWERTR